MAQTITIQSTKGGVGKTTKAFNLASLLADLGYAVLAIDADPQGSLSKAFNCATHGKQAPMGLIEMLHFGELTNDMISNTAFNNLDVVESNAFQDRHEIELSARGDRFYRIKRALKSQASEKYDVIIIDSKGAIGALQDAATVASDIILTPVAPDVLSAREYLSGSERMIQNLKEAVDMGLAPMPKILAFLNKMERTVNAKSVADGVLSESRSKLGQINVLTSRIPHSKAYTEAMTLGIPVHIHEFVHAGKQMSAYLAMHRLVWEIFPSLQGVFATNQGKISVSDIERHYGNWLEDVQQGGADE